MTPPQATPKQHPRMLKRTGKATLGPPNAPADLAHLDPRFAPLINRHGPPRVDDKVPLFQALVETICHQQLSMNAATTIHQRIHNALSPLTPTRILQTPPSRLTATGLSQAKTRYVRAIAKSFTEGGFEHSKVQDGDKEETRQRLMQLPGIGPWSAKIIMIFHLHHADTFPATDAGLIDATTRVLRFDETPSPQTLREHAENWQPYRSLAAWYLWAQRDRLLRIEGKR